ncbi:MAG: sulfotransferase domain-containing protein [Panacagrimonas sp.]
MRWNLTSRGRRLRKADGFFVSVPKSGRTWFRTLWAAYWCNVSGIAFDVRVRRVAGMPHIHFTHDRWEQRANPSLALRLLGHDLVPRGLARKKSKVLLVRDPRDVIVSIFFQVTKRPNAAQRYMPSSVTELVHDPRVGFTTVVATMNGWYEEWAGTPQFALFRYEDARADPAVAMRRWLAHHGVTTPDEAALAHAVSFSDFRAMQERERAGTFEVEALAARDRNDTDSYKTRRGKIGGFVDYLDADDLAYCNAEMTKLLPVFAYKP